LRNPSVLILGTFDGEAEEEEEDNKKLILNITVNPKHQSLAQPAMRPLTLGNWMFDVVADLTKPVPSSVPAPDPNMKRDAR
jgi:ATP-binding cassette subfamily B (MDR/TAP) protein 1